MEKKKREYHQRNLEKDISVLTQSQVKALLCLAKYRYLTVKQMHVLGVSKNIDAIRKTVLYRLAKRSKNNLVQFQDYFGVNITNGRMPFVYALTIDGVKRISGIMGIDEKEIFYPVGKIQYVNDFFHREAYIDFCIELEKWKNSCDGRELISLTHYFDKLGANRSGKPSKSVNRVNISDTIGDIEPDGLALINTGEKIRAIAIELHNKTDTKRVIEQLAKHTHAINNGVISKKLGHDKASFVFSVSMTPEQKNLIIERFNSIEAFRRFDRLFIFSDIQTIQALGIMNSLFHCDGELATVL